MDFETDIKTKQGEGRYVVQYELDGQKGKFITASEEMKNILDQIKEMGELPFETVIKRETFGGNKTKYVFSWCVDDPTFFGGKGTKKAPGQKI